MSPIPHTSFLVGTFFGASYSNMALGNVLYQESNLYKYNLVAVDCATLFSKKEVMQLNNYYLELD